MDHFKNIYSHMAAEYHQMIRREDADGNLTACLQEIAPWAGKTVIDLGTGTGRIPLLVHREAARVIGVDLHYPMLVEHRKVREDLGGAWQLLNADNRRLPLPDGVGDILTAGWAIGHMCGWHPGDWYKQIAQVLREMMRVARPGGILVILETMTTGGFSPAPPTDALAAYYRWLEEDWRFKRRIIRTDYQFESEEDAVEKTTFFFGADLAHRIRQNGWVRLPEWTGVWHRSV